MRKHVDHAGELQTVTQVVTEHTDIARERARMTRDVYDPGCAGRRDPRQHLERPRSWRIEQNARVAALECALTGFGIK